MATVPHDNAGWTRPIGNLRVRRIRRVCVARRRREWRCGRWTTRRSLLALRLRGRRDHPCRAYENHHQGQFAEFSHDILPCVPAA
jgi:hypothetical protein